MEEAANWATESGEVASVSNASGVLWDYWGTDAEVIRTALDLGGTSQFPEASTVDHVWTDSALIEKTGVCHCCTGWILVPKGQTLRFRMKAGGIMGVLVTPSATMANQNAVFNVQERNSAADVDYNMSAVEVKNNTHDSKDMYVRFNLTSPPLTYGTARIVPN